MTKTTANVILTLGDIFCVWGLWAGGHEFQRILADIHNHVKVIHYGNRVAFFIFGVGGPILHCFMIIGHFRPALINKISKLISWGAVVLVAGLIAGGIVGSFYLTNSFKNAGYIYCRKASGISAVSKSVVYTIDADVCEEVVATKPRRF